MEHTTWVQGNKPSTPLLNNQPTPQDQKTHQAGMEHIYHQDEAIEHGCMFCCCLTTIFCISGPCILHEYIFPD